MPLNIGEVMTPDPLTAPPGMVLAEAAATMREKGVGSVIVENDKGVVVGILTERDLVKAAADGAHPTDAKVDQWMTPSPVTLEPDRRCHRRARPNDGAPFPAHPGRRRRPSSSASSRSASWSRRPRSATSTRGRRAPGKGSRTSPSPRPSSRSSTERPGASSIAATTPSTSHSTRPSSTSSTCCTTAISRRTTPSRRRWPVCVSRRSTLRRCATSPTRTAPSWPPCRLRSRPAAPPWGSSPGSSATSDPSRRKRCGMGALVPTLVAALWRLDQGNDPIDPNPDLSRSRELPVDDERRRADRRPGPRGEPVPHPARRARDERIDVHVGRVIASTGADVGTAVVGGCGALSGPLHGGAPSLVARHARRDRNARERRSMGEGRRQQRQADHGLRAPRVQGRRPACCVLP